MTSGVAPGLTLRNNTRFNAGNTVYVGELGSETRDKATVAELSDKTVLTLISARSLPHATFSAVTAVLGDRIRIYRAVNVDDTPPDLSAFSVPATRGRQARHVLHGLRRLVGLL